MIKSYKLKLEANNSKLKKIKEIAKEYRKRAKRVLNIQLTLLFKDGKLNKNYKLKNIQTKLSARYLQTLQYQIVSMLESYLSNRELDLGLSNLFATNKGDLLGRRFIDKLIEYDNKIVKLQKNIQKSKIKLSKSKRYKKLVYKLRKYLKNEINRVINRVIKIYSPKEIIIERLNFQSPKLSKRLNRILSNFGKGLIRDKFNQLKEEYGIKTTEVNPAYTSSQTYSKCGYVSPRNRKSQSLFICDFCNKKQNSDVNSAKNILLRSSQKIKSIYLSKRKILDELIKEFIEQHKKVSSSPSVVTNPYFKDFSYG